MSVTLQLGQRGDHGTLGTSEPKQSYCADSEVYKVCISNT
jgi:hypothetical protein